MSRGQHLPCPLLTLEVGEALCPNGILVSVPNVIYGSKYCLMFT